MTEIGNRRFSEGVFSSYNFYTRQCPVITKGSRLNPTYLYFSDLKSYPRPMIFKTLTSVNQIVQVLNKS